MTEMSLPRAAPGAGGFCAERLARLDAALDAEIAARRMPGAAIAVARRGRIVHAAARGQLTAGGEAPMPLDAIFRIYSMTKPLTSVAALILMEQGRLQLADAVIDHLPEFDPREVSVATTEGFQIVPARRRITIHDLLTHSSGLTYGMRCANTPVREAHERFGLDVNPRGLPVEALVDGLTRAPLAHQPASVWEYGFSTDLLGAVIERVAGCDLGAFLAATIFGPLGMRDTGFMVGDERRARVAEPFPTDPLTGAALLEPSQRFDAGIVPRMHSGGAGALSTLGDYLRFAQMLLAGGALDGRRVLTPASVRLMTADHLGRRVATPLPPGEAAMNSPGYGFGLGVAVRLEDGLANVPGSRGDFFWSGTAGTTFWVDPREALCVVFMAQAPGAMRIRLRRMIRQFVYGAMVD